MPRFPISDLAFYLATPVVLVLLVILFWVVGYDARRAPAYLRHNARWIAWNAVLVIIAACALMLPPAPPAGSHCVETHRVWGPFQMILTCDSYEFVLDAVHPGRLSTLNSYRQNRPLGIMVASILALTEKPPYVHLILPGWLSFVILNFVLLLVALMLFRRLNAPGSNTAAATVAVLGTFLVFNDVVKGFVWSAHMQMWNVLLPLISIALSLTLLRRPERSWRFMAGTGALLGIGSLAYGNLLVCVPAAIAAIALGFRINRERPPLLHLFGKVCLFLGAYAAPMMIWVGILKSITGSFYNAEVECCRMFVWICDSWKAGGVPALLGQTQVFLDDYVIHLWHVIWPALVLLAIALLAGSMSPPRLKETIKERSLTLGAAAITLVVCLCFFGLMGFYRNRLAVPAVIPVIVIASVILTGLVERLPGKQRIITISLVAIAAAGYISTALLRVTWPY